MIVPSAGSSPFHTMPDEVKNCFEESTMYMYDQVPTAVKDEMPTYACMKPAKSSQILSALTSRNDQTLTTWTNIYPENWSTEHILDWLFYVALVPKHKIDLKKFGAEKFQNITGKELCCMNREQFIERMPEYGHVLYEELRVLLKEAEFEEPDMCMQDSGIYEQTFTQINADDRQWMYSVPSCQQKRTNTSEDGSTSAILEMNRFLPLETPMIPSTTFNINGCDYDFDPISLRQLEIPKPMQYDDGYVTEYPDSDRDSYTKDCYPNNYIGQNPYMAGWQNAALAASAQCPTTVQKTKRSPGRPRRYTKSNESSDEDYDMTDDDRRTSGNRGRRQGQSSKGNHLWEFVRDLLKNPDYNNKIIKWEDRKTGVFRFVHSDKVANLWGRKKNNAGMTYEKLSRAMRFSRSAGYFADLPKDGKFPKKLCFKFGDRAHSWLED